MFICSELQFWDMGAVPIFDGFLGAVVAGLVAAVASYATLRIRLPHERELLQNRISQEFMNSMKGDLFSGLTDNNARIYIFLKDRLGDIEGQTQLGGEEISTLHSEFRRLSNEFEQECLKCQPLIPRHVIETMMKVHRKYEEIFDYWMSEIQNVTDDMASLDPSTERRIRTINLDEFDLTDGTVEKTWRVRRTMR